MDLAPIIRASFHIFCVTVEKSVLSRNERESLLHGGLPEVPEDQAVGVAAVVIRDVHQILPVEYRIPLVEPRAQEAMLKNSVSTSFGGEMLHLPRLFKVCCVFALTLV